VISLHGDLLGERARLTPNKTALVFVPTGERFTYAALDARAAVMARVLRERLGLAAGGRFGLLSGNSVPFLDAMFGGIKAGCVSVPMGTRLTVAEMEYLVADSGMRALLVGPGFETAAAALAAKFLELMLVALPSADAEALPGACRYDAEAAELAPSVFRREPRGPEDLCMLLYTSGTTGRPKGVMVPHRMVSWNGINTALSWQLREEDVSSIYTPLYHAGGLGAFLTPVMAAGGTIVLHAGFDPAEIWRTIAAERCTVVLGVPTTWKLLAEAPEFETADLSSIRWLISGGAPLPLHVIETYQRRGVVFKQGYGLTEVGVNCFAMTVEESIVKKGSIGKPMMFTEAKLEDEAGEAVLDGEVGELCLRGPHVCLGYWNNPEATAAALEESGWFHTGDLARRDADGFCTIAGRKKDMLISGGVNVYPAEIEGELLLCSGVADAAVVGIPHETWGEVGVAFVVRRPGSEGSTATPAAMTAALEAKLARYKVPKEFVFVEALPRTAYGKVVKGELREAYLRSKPLLAHLVEGTGEPLLLLNGGMMSYSAWGDVAASLASRWRLVRCDFRGQLLSPGPPPTTFAGHAEDLVALLDALGLPQVDVVGTSFGAEAGLVLASRHPSRVRSLVLVTAVDRFDDEMSADLRKLGDDARAALAGGTREAVYDEISRFAFSPAWAAAHADELKNRSRLVTGLPDRWFRDLALLVDSLIGLDLTPYLAGIRCPVLIIRAGEDRAMPRERTLALAEMIPGAELVEVSGSGHALFAEKPQELLAILEEFQRRHAAG
jgi:fatty-acyl-CoA synthase